MDIDLKRRTIVGLRGGLLVALAAMCLPGCDNGQDSADAAIRTASYELKALASVRPRATGPVTRTKTYELVVRELQPVYASGDKEQKLAAARMLSKAQAGLARIQSEEAQQLEFESMDLVRRASQLLQEYRRQMVYADALVSAEAGSGAEIEELQRMRDVKDADRARMRSARDQMAAQLDERKAEANALFERATGKRSEAGAIRAVASDADVTERLEIIGQAIAIEREADALEVEAELILADVARQAPDLAALDQQLRLQEKESSGFERNASLLRDRDQAMREQSQESRSEARNETAAELHDVLVELQELRGGPLVERYENANEGFERAIGTFQSVLHGSRGKDKSGAAQDLAGLQKSRASAMATWMSGEHRAVALLTAVTSVEPALSEDSLYQSMLADRTEAMEMATSMVRNSFESAGAALSGAGEDEMALKVQELMLEVLNEEAPASNDTDVDES